MIILHEVEASAGFGKSLLVVGFRKEAASVSVSGAIEAAEPLEYLKVEPPRLT